MSEVLILHGSPGSGKSTLAGAISELPRVADLAHAVIDLDELSLVHPRPRRSFARENLASIWPDYAAVPGVRVLIPSVIADEDELVQLRAAVPYDRFPVCELTPPRAVLEARVLAREVIARARLVGGSPVTPSRDPVAGARWREWCAGCGTGLPCACPLLKVIRADVIGSPRYAAGALEKIEGRFDIVATSADVCAALKGLQEHPDDHGWHSFYAVLQRLFEAEARGGEGPLTRITRTCHESRPNLTPTHYATLLGIASKSVAGHWRNAAVFDRSLDVERRAAILKPLIEKHESYILDRVLTRQNSFSSARRFLVPQAVVSHFAARHDMPVRLADLGTGAGLLPRQLNSRSNFDHFAPGLVWRGWDPAFVEARYEARWGIDRIPEEDTAWVRQCYGPSEYYDLRYAELDWAFAQPDVRDADLAIADLDLLGPDKLFRFLREKNINVVTCSFVLYQYEPPVRESIVEAVVNALPRPGVLVSVEPTGDLLTPGAFIRAYSPGNVTPFELGRVSNGHCIGEVELGEDFATFRRQFL